MGNSTSGVGAARRALLRRTFSSLLSAALAVAASASATFAADDPCAGRHVRSLGGAHAVSQKPLRDLADLHKRLPMLEDGMREAILKDPSLNPETMPMNR